MGPEEPWPRVPAHQARLCSALQESEVRGRRLLGKRWKRRTKDGQRVGTKSNDAFPRGREFVGSKYAGVNTTCSLGHTPAPGTPAGVRSHARAQLWPWRTRGE